METISQDKNTLKFIKNSEKAIIPTKATDGSAGMDLYACLEQDLEIKPRDLVKVPCGIAVSLPGKNYAGLIFSRSGLGVKHGIALSNGVGVVDSDYRGEICVGLCNLGDKPYTIKNGDRIAQFLIIKTEYLPLKEVEKLNQTQRGKSGFGSTGV